MDSMPNAESLPQEPIPSPALRWPTAFPGSGAGLKSASCPNGRLGLH